MMCLFTFLKVFVFNLQPFSHRPAKGVKINRNQLTVKVVCHLVHNYK